MIKWQEQNIMTKLVSNGNILIIILGTTNYNMLSNKPTINNIKLEGNKTSKDLGIKQDYTADDIKFTDGETFQEKYNNGELKGEQGATGANGANGEKGATGDSGVYIGTEEPTGTQNVWIDDDGTDDTLNYNEAINKPKINGIELSGNKTSEELGIISGGSSSETVSSKDYEHIISYEVQGSGNIIFTSNAYPKLENCKELFIFIEKFEDGAYTDVYPQFMKNNDTVAKGIRMAFSGTKKCLVSWLKARESYWKTAYEAKDNLSGAWTPKFNEPSITPANFNSEESYAVVKPFVYKDWNKLNLICTPANLPAGTKIDVWGRK